jgi:hypothetical protein
MTPLGNASTGHRCQSPARLGPGTTDRFRWWTGLRQQLATLDSRREPRSKLGHVGVLRK